MKYGLIFNYYLFLFGHKNIQCFLTVGDFIDSLISAILSVNRPRNFFFIQIGNGHM